MVRQRGARVVRLGLAVGLVLLAYALIVRALSALPLESVGFAIDWRGIWAGLRGGKLRYGTGIRNPPWGLLPLLPLGLLPFFQSWALLSLGTLWVMLQSVPRVAERWRYVLGALLLISSYPAVRHLVDGNLEGVVLGGLLLVRFGYRARNPIALGGGLLLASAKPQESWLVLLVVLGMTWRHWERGAVARYSAVVAVVVLPLLAVYGPAWARAMFGIEQRGSVMDSSLVATGARLGLPFGVVAGLWGGVLAWTLHISYTLRDRALSSLQSAFLVAAGLLLAPYAAGNSLVTVVALGMVPLFFASPGLGLLLLAATDAQYLFSASFRYHASATYVTALLLLSWGVFGLWLRRHPPAPAPSAQTELGALPPAPARGAPPLGPA